MNSDSRKPTSICLILICWAAVNLLIYYALEWYESSCPMPIGSPSRLALQLFNTPTTTTALPCRLLSPSEMTADQRFPLLIFLHGAGQRGDDNDRQLLGLPEQMAESKWRTRFPSFVLAPQCPERSDWTREADQLFDLLRDVITQHPIDLDRVYLTGLSMGGSGCWTDAAKDPELFAAVVPICGGGDTKTAERLRDIPIWAIHGAADNVIPVRETQMMIAAIKAAGGQPNYTELPNVGTIAGRNRTVIPMAC